MGSEGFPDFAESRSTVGACSHQQSDPPPPTTHPFYQLSQVARCTKIISPNTEDAKYVINVKQIAKFVVGLAEKVSPTDIEARRGRRLTAACSRVQPSGAALPQSSE